MMNGADLLTQKQAAFRLGVTVRRLYRWRRDHRPPPYYFLNGRFFYRVADLDNWIRAGRRDG